MPDWQGANERRAQAWDNVAVDKAQLRGEGFPPLRDEEVRRMEVPGASHIMHEDNPQVVNEAIAGWV